MNSSVVKGIIYIIVFLISDLFGYKITPISTTTPSSTIEEIDFSTSTIEFVTSSIDSDGNIKIEIKTPSSTIVTTSNIKDISSTSITSSIKYFDNLKK